MNRWPGEAGARDEARVEVHGGDIHKHQLAEGAPPAAQRRQPGLHLALLSGRAVPRAADRRPPADRGGQDARRRQRHAVLPRQSADRRARQTVQGYSFGFLISLTSALHTLLNETIFYVISLTHIVINILKMILVLKLI